MVTIEIKSEDVKHGFSLPGFNIRTEINATAGVALAGAQKHPEALEYLRTLTSKMTKAQIAAGQALAGKWAQSLSGLRSRLDVSYALGK